MVVLTGPRQCGKTTLARQVLDPESLNYFDLEDSRTRALFEEPMTALEPLTGLVVIDEVQLAPDLFPLLRVLADRRPLRARSLDVECVLAYLLDSAYARERQKDAEVVGKVIVGADDGLAAHQVLGF